MISNKMLFNFSSDAFRPRRRLLRRWHSISGRYPSLRPFQQGQAVREVPNFHPLPEFLLVRGLPLVQVVLEVRRLRGILEVRVVQEVLQGNKYKNIEIKLFVTKAYKIYQCRQNLRALRA